MAAEKTPPQASRRPLHPVRVRPAGQPRAVPGVRGGGFGKSLRLLLLPPADIRALTCRPGPAPFAPAVAGGIFRRNAMTRPLRLTLFASVVPCLVVLGMWVQS